LIPSRFAATSSGKPIVSRAHVRTPGATSTLSFDPVDSTITLRHQRQLRLAYHLRIGARSTPRQPQGIEHAFYTVTWGCDGLGPSPLGASTTGNTVERQRDGGVTRNTSAFVRRHKRVCHRRSSSSDRAGNSNSSPAVMVRPPPLVWTSPETVSTTTVHASWPSGGRQNVTGS